ncbi:MAG: hypothetical protein LBR54_00665, partial [Oscillospiraceae bacterium]|nr:hypothetical protein [Oscillospiraceae bacterium]
MKGASKYIVAVLVIAAAVIGGYWLITKQPGVHIGELNLVSEENEMINLLGYEAVNYYKGSSEDVPLPEFNELLNVMP